MNRIYTIPLLAIAVLIATACGKAESEPPAPAEPATPAEPTAICFGSASSADASKGRAATLIGATDQAEFRAKPFAVYGDWIYDVAADERLEIFHNQQVIYNQAGDSPSGWNYTPPKRWQMLGEYDFRAFWPATATVMGTATARTLALEYSMISSEEDLMVAYTHCVAGNEGKPVELRFHHTLAAVCVKFKSGTTDLNYRIKNLYFTSLYYIGALPYDATESDPDLSSAWVLPGVRSYVDTQNFALSERIREWSGERAITASEEGFEAHYDLMLPQTLLVTGDTPRPAITFTLEVDWDTAQPDVVTTTIPLPTDVVDRWEAGKRYTYLVTAKPDKVDIEVRTTPWDEVDATGDDIIF